MHRLLFPLIALLLLHSSPLKAQSHKSHWYFGIGAGIRFENGEPKAEPKANTNSYIGSVSMSDSSGNLLFYTNGRAFFNKNHEEMPNSTGQNSAFSIDVIAIPSTLEQGVYFVYTVEYYGVDIYKVDMNADGGLGDVLHVGGYAPPKKGYFVEIATAIKSCSSNSYWLLSIYRVNEDYAMICYDINMSTGQITEVSSLPIPGDIKYTAWELITSSNGEFVSLVSPSSVYLIKFDPQCGRFKDINLLDLPESYLAPRGACFSPNDNYLYLTYKNGSVPDDGWIYQIDYQNLNDPDLYKNFKKVAYPLYTMLNGPDNRLYILTHHIENDLMMIDRVENPDILWSSNSYSTGVVGYPNTGVLLPFLPNFVNDTRNCSELRQLKLANNSFCVDDSIVLQLSNIEEYDSIFLIDRKQGTYFEIDESSNISLPKAAAGVHHYELVWKHCGGRASKRAVEVHIFDYPEIENFDTTLCTGDSFSLPAVGNGLLRQIDFKDNGNWLPYSKSFLDEGGQYRTELKNKGCTSIDSFDIDIVPPLLTSLGDSFSFCEEEGTPIILDAGKGFEGYKWYPTGDSTQWIAVRKKGEYYVVVNDSRGCSGRGDAKVYSDCLPRIYIPNAFSPNGNGLNDSFYVNGQYIRPISMRVYDRWGAIVHYATGNSIAWDGTKNGEVMPVGTYIFVLTYKEAHHAKKHILSGPVHLLK